MAGDFDSAAVDARLDVDIGRGLTQPLQSHRAWHRAWHRACLLTCVLAYLLAGLLACLLTFLLACLRACLLSAAVVLFSFTSCPFCKLAKEALEAKGVAYKAPPAHPPLPRPPSPSNLHILQIRLYFRSTYILEVPAWSHPSISCADLPLVSPLSWLSTGLSSCPLRASLRLRLHAHSTLHILHLRPSSSTSTQTERRCVHGWARAPLVPPSRASGLAASSWGDSMMGQAC